MKSVAGHSPVLLRQRRADHHDPALDDFAQRRPRDIGGAAGQDVGERDRGILQLQRPVDAWPHHSAAWLVEPRGSQRRARQGGQPLARRFGEIEGDAPHHPILVAPDLGKAEPVGESRAVERKLVGNRGRRAAGARQHDVFGMTLDGLQEGAIEIRPRRDTLPAQPVVHRDGEDQVERHRARAGGKKRVQRVSPNRPEHQPGHTPQLGAGQR